MFTENEIEYPEIEIQSFGRRPTTKDDIRALLCLLSRVSGNMMEVGTWYGKTTYEIAVRYPDRTIYTVDYLENRIGDKEQNARAEFFDLCKHARHLNNVQFDYVPSYDIDYKKYDNIQMIFIDGDHSYSGVKIDTIKALECETVKIIAWHDARNGHDFGVNKYLSEEISKNHTVNIFNGSQVAYIEL
jgi:precorrin-6B methylase 2